MKDWKGAGFIDIVQKFVLVVIWVTYAEHFWDLRTAKTSTYSIISVCSQLPHAKGAWTPLRGSSLSLPGFIMQDPLPSTFCIRLLPSSPPSPHGRRFISPV